MALFLEDFHLGESYITRGRTIGEGDITLFAGLSGDYTPLHMDEDYMSKTAFGTRIAHGTLTLSVAIGMMTQLGLIDETVIALLKLEWGFSGPVKIGDTIHAKVTPVEARRTSKGDNGVVKLRFDVRNHRGEAVQEGFMTILIKARTAA